MPPTIFHSRSDSRPMNFWTGICEKFRELPQSFGRDLEFPAEKFRGLPQSFLKRHLGLPAQDSPRLGNIRLALPWIVLGERQVRDGGRAVRQPADALGEFQDRDLV